MKKVVILFLVYQFMCSLSFGQTQPNATIMGLEEEAPSTVDSLGITPKLWLGLPGHLDDAKFAKEISDLFRSPTPALKRVLELATVMELRCTSLKQGALADDDALTAILSSLSKNHVHLVIRLGVLGRTDKAGFRHDLDALVRVERKGYLIHGIVCESVLSSAKERTGLDKGGQVKDRSNFVADAVLRARDVVGHDLLVYIGDTSLAQGQKPNRRDKYDFVQDTNELIKINAERGVKIAGFVEAFNFSRMSKDAHEVAAAVTHLRSLKCEAGIVPINEETDPACYQTFLVAQVKTIREATHKLDWIVSSTWNRRDAVPTLEQHIKNTLAIADAICNPGPGKIPEGK